MWLRQGKRLVVNFIIGDGQAVLSCSAWADAATLIGKQCDRAFANFETDGKWPYVQLKNMETAAVGKTVKLTSTASASLTALRRDWCWEVGDMA